MAWAGLVVFSCVQAQVTQIFKIFDDEIWYCDISWKMAQVRAFYQPLLIHHFSENNSIKRRVSNGKPCATIVFLLVSYQSNQLIKQVGSRTGRQMDR